MSIIPGGYVIKKNWSKSAFSPSIKQELVLKMVLYASKPIIGWFKMLRCWKLRFDPRYFVDFKIPAHEQVIYGNVHPGRAGIMLELWKNRFFTIGNRNNVIVAFKSEFYQQRGGIRKSVGLQHCLLILRWKDWSWEKQGKSGIKLEMLDQQGFCITFR